MPLRDVEGQSRSNTMSFSRYRATRAGAFSSTDHQARGRRWRCSGAVGGGKTTWLCLVPHVSYTINRRERRILDGQGEHRNIVACLESLLVMLWVQQGHCLFSSDFEKSRLQNRQEPPGRSSGAREAVSRFIEELKTQLYDTLY